MVSYNGSRTDFFANQRFIRPSFHSGQLTANMRKIKRSKDFPNSLMATSHICNMLVSIARQLKILNNISNIQ